jgi:hypothetical protein
MVSGNPFPARGSKLSLASLYVTEDELTHAWQNCSVLNSGYAIAKGLVVEKNHEEADSKETYLRARVQHLLREEVQLTSARQGPEDTRYQWLDVLHVSF